MRDPIAGVTTAAFAEMASEAMFKARNSLRASLGYNGIALEKLEPSHPAFELVKKSQEAAERAHDAVQAFCQEFNRLTFEQNKPDPPPGG